MTNPCPICRKHAGELAQPPGGYIHLDPHWRVCHAPLDAGPTGMLLVEAQRHFLDYAEMTPDEATSYGELLKRLYLCLKLLTGAERIYQLVLLDGAPHFHTWLIPRLPGEELKGMQLLNADRSTNEDEVNRLADGLRQVLAEEPHDF